VKKNVLISVFTLVFVSFAIGTVFANAGLLTKHRGYTGAKKITNCNDCHAGAAKIEKKKGTNYKKVLKSKSCAGKGCHK